MQLHALDLNKTLISARQAFKHINYYCLECQRVVRLRSGPHRQRHFYHVDPSPFCRQHQKGPIHLQLQSYFHQLLSDKDCCLEFPFSTIHRIADVVWFSQKIVFEIQCSAISPEEILARNQDYLKLGWLVVWILHDYRYNQILVSAAENVLRFSPHFFTNMDQRGFGIIYDQFDYIEKGRRYGRMAPLQIDFKGNIVRDFSKACSYPLKLLEERSKNWTISFKGDLMSHFLNTPHSNYLQLAFRKEKQFKLPASHLGWFQRIYAFSKNEISKSYQIIFRFLLERICR